MFLRIRYVNTLYNSVLIRHIELRGASIIIRFGKISTPSSFFSYVIDDETITFPTNEHAAMEFERVSQLLLSKEKEPQPQQMK